MEHFITWLIFLPSNCLVWKHFMYSMAILECSDHCIQHAFHRSQLHCTQLMRSATSATGACPSAASAAPWSVLHQALPSSPPAQLSDFTHCCNELSILMCMLVKSQVANGRPDQDSSHPHPHIRHPHIHHHPTHPPHTPHSQDMAKVPPRGPPRGLPPQQQGMVPPPGSYAPPPMHSRPPHAAAPYPGAHPGGYPSHQDMQPPPAAAAAAGSTHGKWVPTPRVCARTFSVPTPTTHSKWVWGTWTHSLTACPWAKCKWCR